MTHIVVCLDECVSEYICVYVHVCAYVTIVDEHVREGTYYFLNKR